MSVTINQRVRSFSDIDLTFQVNPLTGDVAKKTDDASVNQSIKNLLLTMNYEAKFHPERGNPAFGLLFELANPVTASVLETVISNTIKQFEPRAQLNFVNAKGRPDSNSYDVTVNYSIVNYMQPFTVTVLLQLLR